jgi:hypothetical protein
MYPYKTTQIADVNKEVISIVTINTLHRNDRIFFVLFSGSRLIIFNLISVYLHSL